MTRDNILIIMPYPAGLFHVNEQDLSNEKETQNKNMRKPPQTIKHKSTCYENYHNHNNLILAGQISGWTRLHGIFNDLLILCQTDMYHTSNLNKKKKTCHDG